MKKPFLLVAYYLFVVLFSLSFTGGLFTWAFEPFQTFLPLWIILIISPIPAFAFIFWAFFCAKMLNQNTYILLIGVFILGIFSFFIPLSIWGFNSRAIILIAFASIGIFISFLFSKCLWNLIKPNRRALYIVISFVVSLPILISGSMTTLELSKGALKQQAKKDFDARTLRHYEISDEHAKPYWDMAMRELSSKFNFRDFPTLFGDIKKCTIRTLEDKTLLNFSAYQWSVTVVFTPNQACEITATSLYYRGNLKSSKENTEQVLAAFLSRKDFPFLMAARVFVYDGIRLVKQYEIPEDEILEKIKLCEAEHERVLKAHSARK